MLKGESERNVPLEITTDAVYEDSNEEDGVEVRNGRCCSYTETP